jgi:hypothetical protein
MTMIKKSLFEKTHVDKTATRKCECSLPPSNVAHEIVRKYNNDFVE